MYISAYGTEKIQETKTDIIGPTGIADQKPGYYRPNDKRHGLYLRYHRKNWNEKDESVHIVHPRGPVLIRYGEMKGKSRHMKTRK